MYGLNWARISSPHSTYYRYRYLIVKRRGFGHALLFSDLYKSMVAGLTLLKRIIDNSVV